MEAAGTALFSAPPPYQPAFNCLRSSGWRSTQAPKEEKKQKIFGKHQGAMSMPNNRDEREKDVHSRYGFVVTGGEYSLADAALMIVDGIITGGTFTAAYLQDEVKQFGIDLATAMAGAGINPANEPLYFDKFVFENWEDPALFPGGPTFTFPLPNKFVPYVAARKRAPSGTPAGNTYNPIDTPPRGVIPVNFNEKLAWAFAYVKNAWLLSQGKLAESLQGHYVTAIQSPPNKIGDEIKDKLRDCLAYLNGDPVLFAAANIFAYIKAGQNISRTPPITPDIEPLQGHFDTASHEPITGVRVDAQAQANQLKSNLGL